MQLIPMKLKGYLGEGSKRTPLHNTSHIFDYFFSYDLLKIRLEREFQIKIESINSLALAIQEGHV